MSTDKTHDATKDGARAVESKSKGAANESKETDKHATNGGAEHLDGNIEGAADGVEAPLTEDADGDVDRGLDLDE